MHIKSLFLSSRKLKQLKVNVEVNMYLDSVVVLGLVIVALSCVMITYVGIYAYKHIKADLASHPDDAANKI